MFAFYVKKFDVCSALHFQEVGKLANILCGHFLCSHFNILGFRPPCRQLMLRLPLEGVRQRESGTLLLFPHFYKSF